MEYGRGGVRISEFVRGWVPRIITYLEQHDPEELKRLLDPAYSYGTFGLMGDRAFFKLSDEIHPGSEDDRRYGKRHEFVYRVGGRDVRLNSQWFDRQWPAFERYLTRIGLTPDNRDQTNGAGADHQPSRPATRPTRTRQAPPTLAIRAPTSTRDSTRTARLTGLPTAVPNRTTPRSSARNHIGNAQNLWVRNVLDRVRPDARSYGGWLATLSYFNGECAYCGTPDGLEKDHLYGLNAVGLGEHREGNIVPACKRCNAEKSKGLPGLP